ncbi:hypothetical protein niasHT_032636 [Heterodera trifolii]|uniref:Alkaline ceramidase n=1 Tax=Heterodera trifolii TaxID=157864 RepID=A0ABD2I6F9_9BILA
MDHWFAFESGMPWCESLSDNKYKIVPFVADRVNPVAICPHAFLALNGLASAYYHATLSLFGQLVDELFLLHMMTTCLVAYTPVLLNHNMVPRKLLKEHLPHFRLAVILLSVSVSVLGFIEPAVNAFVLIASSLPCAIFIYHEGTRKGGISEAPQLTKRILFAWIMAVSCWLADKMICDLWLQLGTPYLHAIWHLLAAYAGYNVFLMFSLLDIKRYRDGKQHNFGASVRYFPSPRGLSKDGPPILAFPYLVLVDDEANAKYLE